jgi:diguanylate cyclase (GGDEF)-like protein/PAS domain S-box-containing protein
VEGSILGEFYEMSTNPSKAVPTRLPLRAAGFVALICVVILGMSGWREWSSRANRLKAAEVEMANLARSLTQHAEDSLELLDTGIIGVVSRLETDGTGPETLAKLHKVLAARKEGLKRIYGIVITDENGNWLTSSGVMGVNIADREYFQHHKQSAERSAFIGRPIKSKTDGEWIITVSRRFNHPDGSFAGLVFAAIGAKYFSQFYRQFDIGAHGAITLMNAGGVVLARSQDNDTYVGRDMSNGSLFRDALMQAPYGAYYFRSPLDGMERVSFYRRSDQFRLVVLATVQQDEVLAPWRHAAMVRMMFVFALTSLIAVIGFFLVLQLQRGQRMVVALAAKEANFRVLAEGSSDMVTRIGLDERISYASPSSARIVGWQPDQLVGTPALAGVNPEDLPRVGQVVAALKRGEVEETRVTYRTRHREKSEIWVESTLRVTRKIDGEIDGVIAVSRDMTEQKDMEEKLATLATEDGLTGLANRRRFDARLSEEWARAYRERTFLSLLMIDVDHFKTYNDEYGHPAGDGCLRSVARVLAAEARRTPDLVARYGGEEFAMLLPNTDAAGCARIGERVRLALHEVAMPHAQNLPSGRVTVSLGGGVCQPSTERSKPCTSLIELADRALYAAKAGGRDRLVMSGQVVPRLPVASAAR